MDNLLTLDFWWAVAGHAAKIVIIVAVAIVVIRLLFLALDRFILPRAAGKTLYFGEKRVLTLSSLLKSVISYAVYFVAGVMVLQEFHIDTTSLVAGAGIIGLAIGVGAQNLIKDFMTGFFIVLEDQYAVGDYIVCDSLAGTVEEIGFRVTRLRDFNGVLHIIPNGTISRVANWTRGQMQALVNVPVSYAADLEQVLALVRQACAEVKDEAAAVLLDGPTLVGVVDMRPEYLVVRVIAKTRPLEQWKIEVALRERIKRLFDAAKVPPPLPPLRYGPGAAGLGQEGKEA